MYLYSNRSWATTNRSVRSIHIIVAKELEYKNEQLKDKTLKVM